MLEMNRFNLNQYFKKSVFGNICNRNVHNYLWIAVGQRGSDTVDILESLRCTENCQRTSA